MKGRLSSVKLDPSSGGIDSARARGQRKTFTSARVLETWALYKFTLVEGPLHSKEYAKVTFEVRVDVQTHKYLLCTFICR
jgi:hypothetical protein